MSLLIDTQEEFVSKGMASAEIDAIIDATFLVSIIKDSHKHGVESLPCAESVMSLLVDLFYYESNNQVIWLLKIDLVQALMTCNPRLKESVTFAKLLTNMVMLEKVELKSASLDYFLQICDSDLTLTISTNFLQSK